MTDIVRDGNLSTYTDCGAVHVTMSYHSCDQETVNESSDHKPTAVERISRQRTNSGDPSDIVKITQRGLAYGAYSYHKIDTGGSVLCSLGDSETELVSITCRKAQNHGECPCQTCKRILEANNK